NQEAGVREAVVVVKGERSQQQLVGYVVVEREQAWSDVEISSKLREKLPEYMVPSVFVMLDALPLTVSGKVDRKRLPEVEVKGERGEKEGPRTVGEELIAGIWEEVLKREGVGVEENFFELGGHSLLATQVVSRLRQVLGVEIGVRALFEEPTIRG